MEKANKKKGIDIPKWAIRFCALAMASGLYLAASSNEQEKEKTGVAVATSACAVLGGIGMGIAHCRLIKRERN